MQTRERTSEQRCPYCHDGIARTASAVACSACGSVHHRECFEERGACSIFACAGEETREVALGGTVVRAYRDSHERARRYERSLPFSLVLLVLCVVAGSGIFLGLASGDYRWVFALVLPLFVVLPLLYFATRLLAFWLSFFTAQVTNRLLR